jgi:cyclin-dependent kinase
LPDALRTLLCAVQMEEEGVPSTTLREVSLLKMLSESNHIVK